MIALEENLESISHMIALGKHEVVAAGGKIAKARRLLELAIEGCDLRSEEGRKKFIRESKRSINPITTATAKLNRFQLLNRWQVVMLVTCVEAYLQDVLAAAANADPELMSRSQQQAPYADVIAASSLQGLANDMRARWARGWVSDGGPERWISRLEKMGARDYPKDLGTTLERFWGIRHSVVHAAGVATSDFVRRHPGEVKAAGDPVRVSPQSLVKFVEAVGNFVTPTDAYFLARYPSMLAATTASPPKSGS